jgi:hypothetical protein
VLLSNERWGRRRKTPYDDAKARLCGAPPSTTFLVEEQNFNVAYVFPLHIKKKKKRTCPSLFHLFIFSFSLCK